jgi:hypothetical protein
MHSNRPRHEKDETGYEESNQKRHAQPAKPQEGLAVAPENWISPDFPTGRRL